MNEITTKYIDEVFNRKQMPNLLRDLIPDIDGCDDWSDMGICQIQFNNVSFQGEKYESIFVDFQSGILECYETQEEDGEFFTRAVRTVRLKLTFEEIP